jgi:hypothetical protein
VLDLSKLLADQKNSHLHPSNRMGYMILKDMSGNYLYVKAPAPKSFAQNNWTIEDFQGMTFHFTHGKIVFGGRIINTMNPELYTYIIEQVTAASEKQKVSQAEDLAEWQQFWQAIWGKSWSEQFEGKDALKAKWDVAWQKFKAQASTSSTQMAAHSIGLIIPNVTQPFLIHKKMFFGKKDDISAKIAPKLRGVEKGAWFWYSNNQSLFDKNFEFWTASEAEKQEHLFLIKKGNRSEQNDNLKNRFQLMNDKLLMLLGVKVPETGITYSAYHSTDKAKDNFSIKEEYISRYIGPFTEVVGEELMTYLRTCIVPLILIQHRCDFLGNVVKNHSGEILLIDNSGNYAQPDNNNNAPAFGPSIEDVLADLFFCCQLHNIRYADLIMGIRQLRTIDPAHYGAVMTAVMKPAAKSYEELTENTSDQKSNQNIKLYNSMLKSYQKQLTDVFQERHGHLLTLEAFLMAEIEKGKIFLETIVDKEQSRLLEDELRGYKQRGGQRNPI